ncbi:RNA polymerase sigma factor [Saccharothrix obliqua]|uniref:RNA polymerase sigma factor n=1 Tax=Saccharothrix obliqua TaxID=2861747 RepID=UPI001C5E43C3|nr:RNA polymerase sigma factor [Saccharothrix obliqua]MBW4718498.1 RNA polymerase sigma factor [Saccharothrix obliqua]
MVDRSRAGDVEAFGELVRRHHSDAVRVARLLGAAGDADDVVQDAFVRAYRGFGDFRRGAPFRPWLLRIVANVARNSHRAHGRRVALAGRVAVLGGGPPPVEPDEVVVADERKRRLLAALRQLDERDRQVLECRYLLELTEDETARVLRWPRGTVKSRGARALGRLRDLLGVAREDEVRRG